MKHISSLDRVVCFGRPGNHPVIDLHVHPDYSIDAKGSVEDFCLKAVEMGLRGICFTTHLDTDPDYDDAYVVVNGKRLSVFDGRWLENYESEVRTAGDSFRDRGLQVRLGVEVDYYPGALEVLPDQFHETEFDLVMGSVHLVDHMQMSTEKDALTTFRKLSLEELGERYYGLLTQCVETGFFDLLGHLDIYRRYGERFYGNEIHSLWSSHLKGLTAKMKAHAVGFEVNTSSWRKGMQEPMPESSLIRALRKSGITTVTVGSDAHNPADVGADVDRALDLIRNCGFDAPFDFLKRRPVMMADIT